MCVPISNALAVSAGAGVFGKNQSTYSLESDGSKVMSSRFPIGVGTIYNFDIRGSAGILLVLDGGKIVGAGDKGTVLLVF
jgi:hypothetical protein